ncbi:MAG: PC4/YdbC family ssDNA-binding protein [Selenomonadaceae bacterium]|nr:PC4/YdbC family ssDNA-binding protein [Selenomonadaceae bacterium]
MAYISFVAECGPIYDIKKRLGVVSRSRNGWTKELNLVAWNDGEPRYELRSWSPDHSRMGKGISLSVAEMGSLLGILGDVIGSIPDEQGSLAGEENVPAGQALAGQVL